MVQIFFPNPALAPYVACYNVMAGTFETKEQHLFSARGVPMLVFPFKAPSQTTFNHGLSGFAYPKPSMDEPALLTTNNVFSNCTFFGEVNFVMVLLQTTAAYHFVRGSVQGISNTVHTLNEIGIYGHFEELQDRLWRVQQPAEAVHLIQHHLTKYFERKVPIGPGDFTPVMNHMMRYPAALQVRDLARKFKCSERWIEKQCAIQTGLPPKSWLRLIRYRTMANYWLSHPNASWMDMVVRFNFNDQSHLIRDFRDFTGNPPNLHFSQSGHSQIKFKQNEAGLGTLIQESA